MLRILLPAVLLAPVAAHAQTPSGDGAETSRSERSEQLRQELRRLRKDLEENLQRVARQVEEIDARIEELEGEARRDADHGAHTDSAPRQATASDAQPVTREEKTDESNELRPNTVLARQADETDALLGGPKEVDERLSSTVIARQGNENDARARRPQEDDEGGYEPVPRADRPPRQADEEEEDEQAPYEYGPGIILARGPLGEATLGLRGYVRYINQLGLDESYTDAFGRTFDIQRRQDFQLNRLQILTRGWLFNPRLRWSFYAWTQNVSLGDEAQVVVGGNMTYAFSDHFNLQAGIFSVPSTRSTNQSFPNWLRIDHRTMADEYFRGSYSEGLLAFGEITEGLVYSASLTNNLSILGVSADELDNELNTFSLALRWMPTTGEYGPGEGFGDYEYHEDLATLLGVRFTHSREDAQGQPAVNDFENAQLRLSDGTLLFSPDPFDTGGALQRASYAMLDLDAGAKYRGWSLDAEYYFRWLTDFKLARGTIPVENLYDHGFQAQISTMLRREKLQAYVSGSEIFGEYGVPWDVAFGLTYFPFSRKEVRLNVQSLYTDRSAVGYTAIPYQVGGTGWIWTVDVGYWF